jgi:hypothetical protein
MEAEQEEEKNKKCKSSGWFFGGKLFMYSMFVTH